MQESAGASDQAFRQRIVCGGLDPALPNHVPRLPLAKINEETEIRNQLENRWRHDSSDAKHF